MAPLATAFIRVNADEAPFLHSVDKAGRDGASSLHRHMSDAGKKSGKSFGDLFYRTGLGPIRALGVAAAGIFAGVEVEKFFSESIAAARDANKQAALTAQVIKTTGGAAHVTAGQVDELTRSISEKTGIDHAQIETGARLLLTFTNIRNEVGKGNDIFNQATQAVTDMSVALGEDAKSASIQLGKALQDPIHGVTALRRVGVAFDDQQKKQIETMVKSGHSLDAQKLILHELSREFGGAAAASTTSGQKMHVAFHDLQETVGKALVPALDAAEKVVTSLIVNVAPKVGKVFGQVGKVVSDFVHGFTVGIDSLSDPQTKAAQLGAVLYEVWDTKLKPALQIVEQIIVTKLIPAWVSIVGVIRDDVWPIISQIADFIITKLAPAFAKVWVAAIGAAKAAFERIGKALHDHQKEINEVLHAIEHLASFLLKVLVPVLEVAVKTAYRIISTEIVIVIDVVSALVDAFNWLARTAKSVWHAISAVISAQVSIVKTVIHAGVAVVSALVSAFNTVLRTARSVWHSVTSVVSSAVNAIGGAIHTLIGFFAGIPGDIERAFSSLAELIKQPFIDAFNAVISAYNNTIGRIPGVSDIKPITVSLNGVLSNSGGLGAFNTASPTGGGSTIRKMAEGGLVHATPGGILANIGEGGHDERVTPLDAGGMTSGERQVVALLQQLLRATAVVGPANVAAALNGTARGSQHAARGVVPVF